MDMGIERSRPEGRSPLVGVWAIVVVTVAALVLDRVVDRWWKKNEPLAEAKTSIRDAGESYRRKMAGAEEWREVFMELGREAGRVRRSR